MAEEEKKKKTQSKTSRIIWGIIAIVAIVIGIYYIIRGIGMF